MNEASNWPARTGKRLLVSLLAVALAGGCGSSPAGPADAATSLDAADAGDALPFTIEAHCERDMLWFPLPAELSVYSRALDRVVLASAQHRVLWIAEPSVCAARALVLPQPAMGLALNVAETRAVVGLAGAVVAIDLQSAELGPTLATPSEASGVSVDWRGGVHTAKVGFDGDVDRSPIVSLDTNTGQTRLGPLVDNAGVFVTHPLGRTLYWVSTRFERVAAFDLSASIAVPIASFHDGSAGDVRTCGLLAFAPDGQLAVTGCGTVLRTTNDGFELVPAQRDELAEARAVHVSGGRVALIPALPYPPADSNGEGLPVHLYDLATRKLLQGFEPPRLVPSARPRPARAFLNAEGTRIAVVLVHARVGDTRYALARLGDEPPKGPPSPAPGDGGAPSPPGPDAGAADPDAGALSTPRFASVGLGYGRSCTVAANGAARCWGFRVAASRLAPGSYKQVLPVDEDHTLALSSDGRVSYVGGPTAQLAPSEALISISSSPKMSCGLRADHTIACWGDRPVVTPPDGPFVEVAVGNGAACGRRDDGSVTCWPGDKPVATAVPPVSFKSIGATASHGCGIRQDDTLLCWGWGDKREWSAPPVSGRFRKVEVTDQNNCALALDGVIICWGDQSSKAMPSVPVEGIFTSLSYRASQGCADRQDGAWICWGSNQFGEGTLPEEDHLKKLGGACALTSEGKITCFRDLMEAKPPWPTSTFAMVDGSERDGCALAADGSAKCWSNDLLAFDPVDPPAGHRYRMVKVAVRQACGLRDDTAELECWGRSSTGPTPAGRFSTFALTSTAGCGVREDGTVQCWAAAVNAGVVAVPAPSGVFKQVALGSEDGACALSGAGEIVCWGRGYLPMVSAGPFVQIARGTSWSALRPDGSLAIFDAPGIQPPAGKFVELDPHYSCALTDTGLRRCWDGIFR